MEKGQTLPLKIRKSQTKSRSSADPDGFVWALGVPWQIARAIPNDLRFMCELTDEGILYRPVDPAADRYSGELPSWASNGA